MLKAAVGEEPVESHCYPEAGQHGEPEEDRDLAPPDPLVPQEPHGKKESHEWREDADRKERAS